MLILRLRCAGPRGELKYTRMLPNSALQRRIASLTSLRPFDSVAILDTCRNRRMFAGLERGATC